MILVLLLFGWSEAFAAPPPPAATPDVPAITRMIKKLDADFCKAVVGRDAVHFASFLTEDSVFRGVRPSVGKVAIQKDWAPFLTQGGPSLTWRPLEVFVYPEGDLATSRGTFESRRKGKDGKTSVVTGQYLTVWRKQPEGDWKIEYDSGTADKQ